MSPDLALAIWQRALTEEIGLVIRLEDPKDMVSIRQALYDARSKSQDPDLDALILCVPGDVKDEIMLVKKATEMD